MRIKLALGRLNVVPGIRGGAEPTGTRRVGIVLHGHGGQHSAPPTAMGM
jgi:hypothetical protein